MPNILLEIISFVVPLMIIILVWGIPLYRFNKKKTIPASVPIEEEDLPPDMRDFLNNSKQQLSEIGFRPIGAFVATGDHGDTNFARIFLSADNLHEVAICQFKCGDTIQFHGEFNTSLFPHGSIRTTNGAGPSLSDGPKDNIVFAVPWIEEIRTLFEYHQGFCKEAASQSFQFVVRSPSAFLHRLENSWRDHYEMQIRGGWFARNADGSYRWTVKKALLSGPIIFLPIWTALSSWIPKPSKEKLCKRLEARLSKAKKLPPEERSYNAREI